MRCPDCSKFVSFDTTTDPEINSLEVDESGEVTCEARIVNTCAECGTELTDADLDLSADVSAEVEAHREACHGDPDADDAESFDLTVEEGTTERTERTEGKGMKPRRFYGAEINATVSCSCGKRHEVDDVLNEDGSITTTVKVIDEPFEVSVTMADDVQASSMNECC